MELAYRDLSTANVYTDRICSRRLRFEKILFHSFSGNKDKLQQIAMSLQSSHRRIKPSMSIPVLEKDIQEANPLKDLNETLRRLQNQKHELEKKVLANNWKTQQLVAAIESKKAALQISRPYNEYELRKCTEKKGRLQKKINKLTNFSFCIENQITLLEGVAHTGKYAMKSQDMDMTMNNDELRETIDEINKVIEYMRLKSSAKLGRRCRDLLNKPFVSMKNNFCKLFCSNKSISEGPSLATTQPTS